MRRQMRNRSREEIIDEYNGLKFISGSYASRRRNRLRKYMKIKYNEDIQ